MEPSRSDYTMEVALPVREVAEELRRRNAGDRRAYLRARSVLFTLAYRPLIPGAERTLARAASEALTELDARMVRFAAGRYFIEVDFIFPAEHSVQQVNVLLRRMTSRRYKEVHRGAGTPSSNGSLWMPRTVSETLPPLLEKPQRFNYETI